VKRLSKHLKRKNRRQKKTRVRTYECLKVGQKALSIDLASGKEIVINISRKDEVCFIRLCRIEDSFGKKTNNSELHREE